MAEERGEGRSGCGWVLAIVLLLAALAKSGVLKDLWADKQEQQGSEEDKKARGDAISKSFREKEEDSGVRWVFKDGQSVFIRLYYPTVTKVRSGSAAEAAGFRVGDKILSFDVVKMGRDTKDETDHLQDTCRAYRGKDVPIVVKREAEKVRLTVRVPAEGVLGIEYQMEKW